MIFSFKRRVVPANITSLHKNSTKPSTEILSTQTPATYRRQNNGTKRINTVKISRRPAIISIAITHLPTSGRWA